MDRKCVVYIRVARNPVNNLWMCWMWTGKPRRMKPTKYRKSMTSVYVSFECWNTQVNFCYIHRFGCECGNIPKSGRKSEYSHSTITSHTPKRDKIEPGNQHHPGQGALADLHTASHNFRCLCFYRCGCVLTDKRGTEGWDGRERKVSPHISPFLANRTMCLVRFRRKIHCLKSKSARGIRITIWQNPRHSA